MRILFALLRKAALTPPNPNAAPAASPAAKVQRLRLQTRTVVEKLFGKYLLWTNTVSCGLLMAAGDAVAQRIETRHERNGSGDVPAVKRTPFDWQRCGIMFMVGFTQGPVQHVFYGWLDRRFLVVNARNVAKKIALDQSIMSPVCIVQFFLAAGLFEGQSLDDSLTELRSKFMTVFLSDCMFWPIAQFINFTFTPAPYRVMYINVLTMLYNVWLSIVKHNDDLAQLVASPPSAAIGNTAPAKDL